MTWFKMDDQFFSHPKVREAGRDAVLFYIAAGCHCARHLTDGAISLHALPLIAAEAFVDPESYQRCVEVGLIDRYDDRLEIHDYLKYNPSREKVMSEREKRAKAGAMGAAKRWASQTLNTTDDDRIDNVDAPVPSRPDVPTERKKRKRNLQPDETFVPTDSHIEFARGHGLDLQREIDHWVADCQAKARTYDRLNAGFTTWLHNAVNFGRGSGGRSHSPAEKPTRPEPRMCPTCANTGRYFDKAGELVACEHEALRRIS